MAVEQRAAAVVYNFYSRRMIVAVTTLLHYISEGVQRRFLTYVYVTYIGKPYAKRKRRKRPRIAHTGPRSRCHRPAHELNKNVDGYEKPASLTKVGRRFLSTQSSSSDVYAYTWIGREVNQKRSHPSCT